MEQDKKKGEVFWQWFTKTYQVPQEGNSQEHLEWPSLPTMSINYRRWQTEED